LNGSSVQGLRKGVQRSRKDSLLMSGDRLGDEAKREQSCNPAWKNTITVTLLPAIFSVFSLLFFAY
jgi:hypothetical protein